MLVDIEQKCMYILGTRTYIPHISAYHMCIYLEYVIYSLYHVFTRVESRNTPAWNSCFHGFHRRKTDFPPRGNCMWKAFPRLFKKSVDTARFPRFSIAWKSIPQVKPPVKSLTHVETCRKHPIFHVYSGFPPVENHPLLGGAISAI